jgi:hypothetical protein
MLSLLRAVVNVATARARCDADAVHQAGGTADPVRLDALPAGYGLEKQRKPFGKTIANGSGSWMSAVRVRQRNLYRTGKSVMR